MHVVFFLWQILKASLDLLFIYFWQFSSLKFFYFYFYFFRMETMPILSVYTYKEVGYKLIFESEWKVKQLQKKY